MNLRRTIALVLLALALSPGTALAFSLNLNVAPSLLKPSGQTGEITYALQEGAHSLITSTTGIAIPHSYIWVNVNGAPVAAVDPFWASPRTPVIE